MKPILLISVFIIFTFSSFSQDSLSFLERELEHMNNSWVIANSPNSIIYSDKFSPDQFFKNRLRSLLTVKKISGITIETKSNILTLTTQEKQLIKNYIKTIDTLTLDDNLFKGSKLIKFDTINNILKDTSRGWRYFRKEYSSALFYILKPFFFRNNSICLTYIIVVTRPGDFEDKIIFYKKENRVWRKWIVAMSGIT